jgi:hypothetical protein
MDPFSVSTAWIGLLAAVAQLSAQITAFVASVRESARDMRAVNRELASLALYLKAFRDDSKQIQYSEGFQQNLIDRDGQF